MTYLIVFLGGGLGAALRHSVNTMAVRLVGVGFPCGTLTVNILGSMLMGVLAGYFAYRGEASQHWRLFMTTGVLGGFTTFSAFSLDAVLLWERHDFTGFAFYAGLSVLASIGALSAGLYLMRTFSPW